MKTIILTTLMILTATSAQAAKDCASSQNNTLRLLSSATAEIVSQAANDARVVVDRNSAEYKQLNAVGIVKPEGKGSYGTGFLVDACHVLTNSHVAFKSHKTGPTGSKVYFSVGQTNSKDKPFTHSDVEGTVIAKGDFQDTDSTTNNDWVIIKLSKSLGKTVGAIPVYQMDPKLMEGRSVKTVGFPGNRSENGKNFSKMHGDLNCKLLSMGAYGFEYHNCQATSGQSGSPVLSKGNDGKFYALAMITGDNSFPMERKENLDQANMAVSFDSGKSDGVTSEGDKIVAALKNSKCE